MEGQRDEYGLTRKQRKFAENVVSGMTLADAYRNSYDAENMKPASIHRRACELMTDGKVKACAEALAAEKKRLVEVATVSDRDMLVRLLRSWSTGEESATNSQLRAAELLGKACGLYRDVVEDHRERPAQVVAAELEAKLAALVERVQPSAERLPQADPVPPKPVPVEGDHALQ
jgi:phage terminase small subunit